MRIAKLIFALFLTTVATAAGLPPASAQQRAPIISVPSEDAEMSAAIAAARNSLPEFWSALDKPARGIEGFALKVGLPVTTPKGADTEHIWVNTIERLAPDRFAGKLGNHPRGIRGKKMGDRVEFTEAQISDWMFMRTGKIVGNETMRPLFKRMPKDQADRLRAMMEKP